MSVERSQDEGERYGITVRDDTMPAAARAIISFMDGSLIVPPTA
jgi:hypothetical protein